MQVLMSRSAVSRCLPTNRLNQAKSQDRMAPNVPLSGSSRRVLA